MRFRFSVSVMMAVIALAGIILATASDVGPHRLAFAIEHDRALAASPGRRRAIEELGIVDGAPHVGHG